MVLMHSHSMCHEGHGHWGSRPGFFDSEEDGPELGFGPGHRGGGRGFRPFGFGGGGGRPGGFGFHAGRKLSSADLQLLILALLGEKPRHGYDLIKAVEERSGGFYTPSPGVIYPALTYLEEAGDAVPEAEGSRKLYRLTEAGKAHLEERRAEADAILLQLKELGRDMDRVREAFAGGGEAGEGEGPFARGRWGAAPELRTALRSLRGALHELRGAGGEELQRVAEILRRAVDEIRRR
jgi:DNA-binding PadR family transcriptional regulator